jgi:hypothetical protein
MTRQQLLLGLGVALAYLAVMLILFPRIGIRDSDSYAYATCARSLATTGKYETLDHVPMTTWPPGYSATLALFPDRLAAARFINFGAGALAVFLLYVLFLRSGWTTTHAACWATALGFAFLSTIVSNCTPDAINIAGFFLVVWLGLHTNRWGFLLAMLLGPALVPFKYVAVVYAPALALEKLIQRWKQPERRWSWIALGVLGLGLSAAAVVALSAWNKQMSGQMISSGHSQVSKENTIQDAKDFVRSPFRQIFSNWNGPVGEPVGLGFYATGLALAGVCFLSLRWNAEGWRSGGRLGVIALLGMLTLRVIRAYTMGAPRLSGPAVVLCLLSVKPKAGWRWPWFAYAGVMIVAVVVNTRMYRHDAGNDQRYIDLVQDVATQLKEKAPDPGIVVTNLCPLLDVHEGVASRIADPGTLKPGEVYVHVTLPNYPPVSSVVMPVEFTFAPADWDTLHTTPAYALYRRR